MNKLEDWRKYINLSLTEMYYRDSMTLKDFLALLFTIFDV